MLSTIRIAQPFRSVAAATRFFSATSITRTSAGYGDPQDEKIENSTPQPNANPRDQTFPSSQPDPHPHGKGKGTGSSSGVTDPEVAGKTGNAGGQNGADKPVTEKEIKETKKIGESAKKEEVGGAGVIGGWYVLHTDDFTC